MSKLKFMKRCFIWTAIITAIIFIAMFFCAPMIEPTLIGNIAKYIFGWFWVTMILEALMYTFGQIIYHWVDDNKERYGKHWFTGGIKNDFRYIKENTTLKGVLKVIGSFVLFFGVFLLLAWLGSFIGI